MSKKTPKTCTRCGKRKLHFIEDSEMPDVCHKCFTKEELHNYIRSDLCKALLDLNVKQKQNLIKNLVDEFKKTREKIHVL